MGVKTFIDAFTGGPSKLYAGEKLRHKILQNKKIANPVLSDRAWIGI